MRKVLEVSRRSFLRLLGMLGLVAAGGKSTDAKTLVVLNPSLEAGPRPIPAAGSYQALNSQEIETLAALVDQIVPQDEFPSASEAGVVRYIDYALATGQNDRLPLYQKGLAATQDAARTEHGRDYHELSLDQQQALLEKIENGEADGKLWEKVSPTLFFEFLWQHTLEGYYGPPHYGGNKNYISWKMVGYPELHGLEPQLDKQDR